MEKINAMKATLEALRSKIGRSSGRESRAIDKRKEEENINTIEAEIETTRSEHAEVRRLLKEAQREARRFQAATKRVEGIQTTKRRRDNLVSLVRGACVLATTFVVIYVAVSSRGSASPYASGLDVYRLVH